MVFVSYLFLMALILKQKLLTFTLCFVTVDLKQSCHLHMSEVYPLTCTKCIGFIWGQAIQVFVLYSPFGVLSTDSE